MISIIHKLKNAFVQVKNEFSSDWKIRPKLVLYEGFGTAFNLSAAVTIASMGPAAPFFWIYVLYFSSTFLLFKAAMWRGSAFLMLLNLGYAIIDIIGIISNY